MFLFLFGPFGVAPGISVMILLCLRFPLLALRAAGVHGRTRNPLFHILKCMCVRSKAWLVSRVSLRLARMPRPCATRLTATHNHTQVHAREQTYRTFSRMESAVQRVNYIVHSLTLNSSEPPGSKNLYVCCTSSQIFFARLLLIAS